MYFIPLQKQQKPGGLDFSRLPSFYEQKEKPRRLYQNLRGYVARPAGFEPTAYRLGGGRSILLSYGRTVHSIIPNAKQLCKAFL